MDDETEETIEERAASLVAELGRRTLGAERDGSVVTVKWGNMTLFNVEIEEGDLEDSLEEMADNIEQHARDYLEQVPQGENPTEEEEEKFQENAEREDKANPSEATLIRYQTTLQRSERLHRAAKSREDKVDADRT